MHRRTDRPLSDNYERGVKLEMKNKTGLLRAGVFTLLFLIVLATSSCSIAPECKQYCAKIQNWATACKKPTLHLTSCINEFDDRVEWGKYCWDKMIEMGDEMDCAKVPKLP